MPSLELLQDPAELARQASEGEEPGSLTHTWRRWRQEKAKTVLKATAPLATHAGSSRWDEQIAFLTSDSPPTALQFHPFEDHLVSADESGHVSYVAFVILKCGKC